MNHFDAGIDPRSEIYVNYGLYPSCLICTRHIPAITIKIFPYGQQEYTPPVKCVDSATNTTDNDDNSSVLYCREILSSSTVTKPLLVGSDDISTPPLISPSSTPPTSIPSRPAISFPSRKRKALKTPPPNETKQPVNPFEFDDTIAWVSDVISRLHQQPTRDKITSIANIRERLATCNSLFNNPSTQCITANSEPASASQEESINQQYRWYRENKQQTIISGNKKRKTYSPRKLQQPTSSAPTYTILDDDND